MLALNVISRIEGTAQSYHIRTTAKNYYEILVVLALVFSAAGWLIRRAYLKEYI